MGIRFDSTDRLTRTTGALPPITSFTVMAWLYSITTTYGAFMTVVGVNPDFYSMLHETGANDRLRLYNGAFSFLGTTSPGLTTWFHAAMTVSGSSAGQFLGYLNGVLEITGDARTMVPTAQIQLGRNPDADQFNGRMAGLKIWSTALTAEEIATEMGQLVPVRTDNLNTWCPFLDSTAVGLTNYNNTGAWTIIGTITTEDGPPVPWMLRPKEQWKKPVGTLAPPATYAPPPRRPSWRFAHVGD